MGSKNNFSLAILIFGLFLLNEYSHAEGNQCSSVFDYKHPWVEMAKEKPFAETAYSKLLKLFYSQSEQRHYFLLDVYVLAEKFASVGASPKM